MGDPFCPDFPVFKLKNKIFAILGNAAAVGRAGYDSINLKCDPHEAQMLRDVFSAVVPGYHMNKTHWNTVVLDGSVPDGELLRMMDHSYALIFRKLPKVDKESLLLRYSEEELMRGRPPIDSK
ncbi:MmcQ/YjbR family DNA-binding protein [bacterium]|nr:MmcQ/YjbR family DNA-binding protein [bacterium]